MTDTKRAQVFLVAVPLIFIPVFALPLFVDPIWWADKFGWATGGDSDLTVYFGRCLGALALALLGTALWASRDPAQHRGLFVVITATATLLAIVHLRGTIEDSQPAIESVETFGYTLLAAAAWLCMPRRRSDAP